MDGAGTDTRELRNALGRFATGVTVITTRGTTGANVGLTANSFSSVSLDPPLVLWSLGRTSRQWEDFMGSENFAVNILAEDQSDIALCFAGPAEDRFADLRFQPAPCGVPIIENSVAWFECKVAARHEGGDHVIFIGEVLDFSYSDRTPLLFFAGGFNQLSDPPEGR